MDSLQRGLKDAVCNRNYETVRSIVERVKLTGSEDDLLELLGCPFGNWSVIHHAAFDGDLMILKYLVEQHPDGKETLDMSCPRDNMTPLLAASFVMSERKIPIVRYILENSPSGLKGLKHGDKRNTTAIVNLTAPPLIISPDEIAGWLEKEPELLHVLGRRVREAYTRILLTRESNLLRGDGSTLTELIFSIIKEDTELRYRKLL